MKKKIVLYNPDALFFDMPLALIALGSQFDQSKYEVIIIDKRIDDNAHDMALEVCEDALCFGVTALTGSPLFDALKISEKVKAKYPNLPIVWGGWHPSLFPVEILSDTNAVDISVYGQGETTFKQLIEHFEGHLDIKEIQGIAYRDEDGNIQKNMKRHLVQMDDLKASDYSLIDAEKYFAKKKRRQFDYISSTGCNFRCTFCADPFVYDRGWTGVDPKRMTEEFTYWNAKYNFTDINFQDETFFTKRKRVMEICDGLIENDINTTWAGTLRGDQANRLTDEEFDKCKKSGLRRVLVGVESGSQEMMDWLKKDIKMEHIWATAQRCADRDIAVIFPFIVGFPGESDQSVMDSLNMAKKLNSMHSSFTTPIFYFKPYPGSKITQDVVANGYELPQTVQEWANFDFIGSAGPWVNKEKYELVENFKFFNKMAHRKHSALTLPLKWISKFRLNNNYFGFAAEKAITNVLFPAKSLS